MKIFVPYRPYAAGGPMTFLANFKVAMAKQGHQVISTFQSDFNILFIIESCHLAFAFYAKLRGRKIIQRLDGVYYPALPGFNGYFHFFKNLRLKIFHNYLADHVIYQSQFAQQSCQTMLGQREKNISIIYNGVAAASSTPLRLSGFVGQAPAIPGDSIPGLPSEALAEEGVFPAAATGSINRRRGKQFSRSRCGRPPRLKAGRGISDEKICSPRRLEKNYSRQDPSLFLQLTTFASFRRPDQIKPILESVKHLAIPYHLHIYGSHTTRLSPLFQSLKNNPRVTYHGSKKHRQLLADIQRHDIFLFSDQSACPNAVLEALAAGLPVVAFNRGSIPELVKHDLSGQVVPLAPHNQLKEYYRFSDQDHHNFALAINEVSKNISFYRKNASASAQAQFSFDHMVSQYIRIMLNP